MCLHGVLKRQETLIVSQTMTFLILLVMPIILRWQALPWSTKSLVYKERAMLAMAMFLATQPSHVCQHMCVVIQPNIFPLLAFHLSFVQSTQLTYEVSQRSYQRVFGPLFLSYGIWDHHLLYILLSKELPWYSTILDLDNPPKKIFAIYALLQMVRFSKNLFNKGKEITYCRDHILKFGESLNESPPLFILHVRAQFLLDKWHWKQDFENAAIWLSTYSRDISLQTSPRKP